MPRTRPRPRATTSRAEQQASAGGDPTRPAPTTTEPVTRTAGGGLRRLRLDLGYDGTGFVGWASQPGLRAVQSVVEAALATALRLDAPAPLTVAGRTDAGVHARGQVAHVDVPADRWDAADPERLVRALAALLPPDVRAYRVTAAPDGFDARFSALGRCYGYRVSDDPAGVDPLRRHDTLSHPRRLDRDAMQAAADLLVGRHDFAAFCRRREGATTVRTLRRLAWSRDGAVLTAVVEADAFCHSMVRSLVGALLAVGDGRRQVGFPASLLERTARAGEVVVAPPHGLTLLRVDYPADADLAARAVEARARQAPLAPRGGAALR